jgi:hypothetical protein
MKFRAVVSIVVLSVVLFLGASTALAAPQGPWNPSPTDLSAGKAKTKAFKLTVTSKAKKGKTYKVNFTLKAKGAKTAKAAVKVKVK